MSGLKSTLSTEDIIDTAVFIPVSTGKCDLPHVYARENTLDYRKFKAHFSVETRIIRFLI
jgi:hypothetical protein